MNLVFMGTPEFAIPSLRRIHEAFGVSLVVTRTDKPSGRGRRLTPSPVAACAGELGIDLLKTERIKGPELLERLKAINPYHIVVVAFGKFLPPPLLNLPAMGCINLHPSLLPKYRGAAPIERVIMNGEIETGVTVMFLDEGMDSGPILLQKRVPIGLDEDRGTLEKRLSEEGAELLTRAIGGLPEGSLSPLPQDEDLATFAPKIEKMEYRLNWEEDALTLDRKVRAFSPSPFAWTSFRGRVLKIEKAEPSSLLPDGMPGKIWMIGKDSFAVSCTSSSLILWRVRPEGGRSMSAREFITGYRPKIGEFLK